MAGDTTAARAAIVRALVAGNGRSNVVPDLGELTRRLVEDGAEFDDAVLFTALAALIGEGVVEQRRGFGIWLSNGTRVRRVGDGDSTDLTTIDGPSWGPGEPW